MPAFQFKDEQEAFAELDSFHLEEVPPSAVVEQLRNELDEYQPTLSLLSPSSGDVLPTQDWELLMQVKDWPINNDRELGIGPHVVLQVDDAEPVRLTDENDGELRVLMKALKPGTHRLSAYLAYPWGEAVRSPGSRLQWRLHSLQSLEGTQPEDDQPWLTVVSPSDLSSIEPILIDWILWNAPLQNLIEGDIVWRMRITLDGESFLLSSEEPIWIKGFGDQASTVQFELLDGMGEAIEPVFNKQLVELNSTEFDNKPIWMNSDISDKSVARLLGQGPQDLEKSSTIEQMTFSSDQSLFNKEELPIPEESLDVMSSKVLDPPKESIKESSP
ncbi:hypothetical protein [Prochlorococcus sp. MIT 1300]|uniref:hypothetical protein n=1 Tax=Prochlorococcus sp. MIT 1300 TaxID=3096218 RepID=UPI002A759926|nr:hypothetical protein [Prochlorococcus sp. MIT 1300]